MASGSANIIIGAPRSGTNMLRDVLTRLPGLGTWPCDEIPYIWRHGNVSYPHDEFSREMARPEVGRWIRAQFEGLARSQGIDHVVEKTCANSLRVGFVHEVLPDANFVVIVRDGVDAALSASRRWTAPFDLAYTMKKVRFVPPSDAPRYAMQYARNRLRQATSSDDRLATWGPVFDGMHEAARFHSVEELSMLQWKRCVDRTDEELSTIPETQVVRLSYETFVRDPHTELERLTSLLEIPASTEQIEDAVRDVSAQNVGKGRERADPGTRERLVELGRETLARHGYPLR
jgi:hypothetical protein